MYKAETFEKLFRFIEIVIGLDYKSLTCNPVLLSALENCPFYSMSALTSNKASIESSASHISLILTDETLHELIS